MKGSRSILPIIVVTLVIVLAACGGAADGQPTPAPSANEVDVDISNNGGEVALAAGDLLIVTLDSNATTGFSWNLSAISDTAVLRKVGSEYVAPPPTDPPLMGQGGQEVWTFESLDKGTASISMKYMQPWMPEADPAGTFDITVIIQ